MRTSVGWVAGWPSLGSDWRKAVAGVEAAQALSSSRPSSVIGPVRSAAIMRGRSACVVSAVCAASKAGNAQHIAAARNEQALTPETDMGRIGQDRDVTRGHHLGCRDAEKSLRDREARVVYTFLTAAWEPRNVADPDLERLALDRSATHHREGWEALTPGVAFTSFDRVSEG